MTHCEDWLFAARDALVVLDDHEDQMTTVSGLMRIRETFDTVCETGSKLNQDEFCMEMVNWGFVDLSRDLLCRSRSEAIKKIVLSLNVSFTDQSKDYCKSVADNKIFDLLASNLESNLAFQAETLAADSDQQTTNDYVQSFCIILGKTLYNCPELRNDFRRNSLNHALRDLMNTQNNRTKITALLCLAYAVDVSSEADHHLLELQKQNIDYLFKQVLQNILSSSNSLTFDGYRSDEILEALSIFARNHRAATEFVKYGIISICDSFLEAHAILLSEKRSKNSDRSRSTIKWSSILLQTLSKHEMMGFLFNEDPVEQLIEKFPQIRSMQIIASPNERTSEIRPIDGKSIRSSSRNSSQDLETPLNDNNASNLSISYSVEFPESGSEFDVLPSTSKGQRFIFCCF